MCRIALISVHGCPLAKLGGKETGGMNVYVRELARAMGKQSMTVDVYTRLTDPSLPEIVEFGPNVRVIHLPAGDIGPMDKNKVFDRLPEFICNVRTFVEREELSYQYVHSHYWLSGWVGNLLASRWNVPHITTFHTLARVKNRALLGPSETERRGEIESRIIAQADAIIASSEHERHAMVDLYGARREKIQIISPGIDLDLFSPKDRLESRKEFGISPDEKVVATVGRMDPIKGFDLLLRAFSILKKDESENGSPDGKMLRLVIGGGGKGDREHDRLRVLARELDLEESVTFVGAIPQTRLPSFYSAADLVVVPSHYESFGFVAAEALACGRPVIASKAGGLPTIVHDCQNGILVPWRRPEAFAEKIDLLLRDKKLFRRLEGSARESVLHLGWESSARRAIALSRALGAARTPELVCSCRG